MTIKKHYIFLSIAVITFFALVGVPQLTGTAFVNNYDELKPVDWLSSLAMKNYEKNKTSNHPIPDNIKTIKLVGNNVQGINYQIEITNATNSKTVTYSNKDNIAFLTKNDTLIINFIKGYSNNFNLSLDSTITNIVVDGLKKPTIKTKQQNLLEFSIKNKSDIILSGNTNYNLKNINVSGQSTVSLINHFSPIIDLNVDNSMIYLDYLNHMDSLKVNLIGKSNIKKKELTVWRDDAKQTFDEIKQQLNIIETKINIFPTGNLAYYNKSK